MAAIACDAMLSCAVEVELNFDAASTCLRGLSAACVDTCSQGMLGYK